MSFGAGAMYQAMEKSYGNGTAAQLGKSPVLNIFAQHPTLSNFFDIYLSRISDLDNNNDGTLTVNEHLDGYYQAVSVQPKLERVTNNSWSVALDSIQVNSKTLKFNTSSIKTVPEGKIAAFLGTGYSYPRLSPAAVDYIYSSIAGAVLSDGRWLVPCLGATNLTFVFG